MNFKTIVLSGLALLATTGCAHRVVYSESYEPEPLVVQRTVVVDHRPHYYYHPRPYERRVVVVNPRSHYDRRGGYDRDWSRRDGHGGGTAPVYSQGGGGAAGGSGGDGGNGGTGGSGGGATTTVHNNVHNNVHTNIHDNGSGPGNGNGNGNGHGRGGTEASAR